MRPERFNLFRSLRCGRGWLRLDHRWRDFAAAQSGHHHGYSGNLAQFHGVALR
ncbi:hypothetical protein [Lysobacter gummosus]|uniref:hypothetical protein n=1 Tax=Lysobacter gummosus TaxID=262324 RepID=UPI00363E2634